MLLCPYASVKYTGAISNLQNRVYFFEFGEKGPHSSEILIHRKKCRLSVANIVFLLLAKNFDSCFFYECEIQSNCRSIVKSRHHTILKPLRCRQLLADLSKWFWCHTRYCSSTKYVVLNNWWLTIEVISMQLTRWWHQASIVFQFHYQEASCRQKRRKLLKNLVTNIQF